MSFFTNKTDAVEFVTRALEASRRGYALTMIIGREKSGDYFASTVTDELSGDIVVKEAQNSSEQPMSILQLPTQAG